MPAMWTYTSLLKTVTEGQNISIKMDDHERLKFQTPRFMNSAQIYCGTGCTTISHVPQDRTGASVVLPDNIGNLHCRCWSCSQHALDIKGPCIQCEIKFARKFSIVWLPAHHSPHFPPVSQKNYTSYVLEHSILTTSITMKWSNTLLMVSGFCCSVNDMCTLWDFTQHRMAVCCQHCRTIYRSHLQGSSSLFDCWTAWYSTHIDSALRPFHVSEGSTA